MGSSKGRAGAARFLSLPKAIALPADYPAVLAGLKCRIALAQRRALKAVNRELLGLYWHVGRTIVQRQTVSGWGAATVERLAHDLRREFPLLEGFSPRNIWRMRAFFLAWTEAREELTQAVSEMRGPPSAKGPPVQIGGLPWGHNIVLLQKLQRREDRLWYAEQASELGWSRATLELQISKHMHARRGRATTNFAQALPRAQSKRAQLALKDPYSFDFLTIGREARERTTERGLLEHMREFLLELGAGFAFIGSQVKLVVGDAEYFVDLLFYHVRLHSYVVVELKATAFKPEHVGKLNFYLSAVDDLLKGPGDQPSIGLLLCRSRDRLRVEYALRGLHKPIGVAQWKTRIVDRLPDRLRGSLPSVEEIEAELGPLDRHRKARG
jgi:predicted nuclease of restriction endonuclease-like (RecB) superfamily